MYPLLALDLPERRGAHDRAKVYVYAICRYIIIIIIIITNTISEFKIY